MTVANQTLADIFSRRELQETPLNLFAKNDIEETAKQASITTPDMAQSQISALIAPAMEELLDIPISKILVNAWTRLQALRDYAHGDKISSGKTYEFPLAKHSITSTHEPRIRLFVNDHQIAEVQVNISLKLLIARAVLKISEGYIRQVQVTGLEVSGQISSQSVEIVKLNSSDFAQELTFDLGDGIKIPPPLHS